MSCQALLLQSGIRIMQVQDCGGLLWGRVWVEDLCFRLYVAAKAQAYGGLHHGHCWMPGLSSASSWKAKQAKNKRPLWGVHPALNQSQVAQNDRPLYHKVANSWDKVTPNYGPLAFQVDAIWPYIPFTGALKREPRTFLGTSHPQPLPTPGSP